MEIDTGNKMADIMLYVAVFNVALAGVSNALGMIKDKTATKLDNKLFSWISLGAGWLKKGLDIIGYNPEHK